MSALPAPARTATDADATRDLYERYSQRIFAYSLRRLGNREEAEDAVQTTFLNAFRGLRRGISPEYEAAWLFKIADNVCRDRRRSASRRGRVEHTRDLNDVQDLLPAPQRAGDDLLGLADALARLPEAQRQAILMREWKGLSYAEIAEELGVSHAAVETNIFRARRSLARFLEQPRTGLRRVRSGALALVELARTLIQGGSAAKIAVTAASLAGAAGMVASPLRDAPAPDSSAPASSLTSTPTGAGAVEPLTPSAGRAREGGRPAAAAAAVRRGRGPVEAPGVSGSQSPAPSDPAGPAREPDPPRDAPPAPGATQPPATAPPPSASPPVAGPSLPLPEASLPGLPAVPALPPPPAPTLPVTPPDIPEIPDLPTAGLPAPPSVDLPPPPTLP